MGLQPHGDGIGREEIKFQLSMPMDSLRRGSALKATALTIVLMPRTGMETPYPESHYRSIVTPNLLPVAYAGSIQQVSPLFSGLYFVDSLFLVAFYRTVQGRKTGLTNKKLKIKN